MSKAPVRLRMHAVGVSFGAFGGHLAKEITSLPLLWRNPADAPYGCWVRLHPPKRLEGISRLRRGRVGVSTMFSCGVAFDNVDTVKNVGL